MENGVVNRAGQPWTGREEEELRDLFDQAESITNIASWHRRSIGAITSRLARLNLIEHSRQGWLRKDTSEVYYRWF